MSAAMRVGVFAVLAASATLATAQTAPPDDLPSAVTFTGGGAIVSDYRFRGISQTNREVALQGTVGVSHASGLYAGAWASTIHDYVAAGGDAEIDFYGGYRKAIGGTTIDGGLLSYVYPGAAGGRATDYFEPYLNASHTIGPAMLKAGLNYAWKQHALACAGPRCALRAGTLYLSGEALVGIPGTPLTISGHAGGSFGRGRRTLGLRDYADYSVRAAYVWHGLTFSAAYVGSDVPDAEDTLSSGRHPAKDGFVFGIETHL